MQTIYLLKFLLVVSLISLLEAKPSENDKVKRGFASLLGTVKGGLGSAMDSKSAQSSSSGGYFSSLAGTLTGGITGLAGIADKGVTSLSGMASSAADKGMAGVSKISNAASSAAELADAGVASLSGTASSLADSASNLADSASSLADSGMTKLSGTYSKLASAAAPGAIAMLETASNLADSISIPSAPDLSMGITTNDLMAVAKALPNFVPTVEGLPTANDVMGALAAEAQGFAEQAQGMMAGAANFAAGIELPSFAKAGNFFDIGANFSWGGGSTGESIETMKKFVKDSCEGSKEVQKDAKSPNGDSASDDFEQMVSHAGYKSKRYRLETSDGYLLSLYRIYKQSENEDDKRGTPVLFLHGIMGSVKDWIMNDKEKVLPYKLVEDGKDVFVAANRGSPGAKDSTKYKASEAQFWAFSHVEFAKFDIPAFLDEIKKITGKEAIYFIAHSFGSKQLFTWLSLGPQNCARIKGMWALAPVCYTSRTKSPVANAMSYASKMSGTAIAVMGSREFSGSDTFVDSAKSAMCSVAGSCAVCKNLLMALGGINPQQINRPWQSLILATTPSSTSYQNIVHAMQEVNADKFGQFDYGPIANSRMYGKTFSMTPPQLHVSMAKIHPFCRNKINLLYAENDWISDKKDVEKLRDELGGVIKNFNSVDNPTWSHFDYLWGKDVDKYVNEPLIKQMHEYDNN